MLDTVARLDGHNLLYRDLIADNGLASGARASVSGVAPTRSRSRMIVAFMADLPEKQRLQSYLIYFLGRLSIATENFPLLSIENFSL